jgi:hypothetical protein
MRDDIFDDGDIQIYRDGQKYFVRYDAGAHQVVMREDEISAEEANRMMVDPAEISIVLFDLQRRLEMSGHNPYRSNI